MAVIRGHRGSLYKTERLTFTEIPTWLNDDCDDARYQMDFIWMQMNPQSDNSENEVNTLTKININEDDLPF